jgi:glutamate synthase (NADPH/NADH) small chain
MPGSVKEINHAIEEGVNFLFNSQPLEIIGNGKIRNLKVGLTELGEPDNTGRRKPILVEGSEKLIEMDKLVIAFGYQADPQDFVVQNNIDITDQGLISLKSDIYKYQTSNPKFFAGGDMIIGSSLAVHAIAHGRDAAKEIIKYLG